MTTVLLNMAVSLDGFAAGLDIDRTRPLGAGGERLHAWMFAPDAERVGAAGDISPTGGDAQVTGALAAATGAVVVGRRTYDVGVDLWGDTPFPVPCFVVTHEARPPRAMKSASFTFVPGVAAAVQQARAAAGARDVLVMGGPEIGLQSLQAGLVDEVQLHLVPVLLGAGKRLFEQVGRRVELERIACVPTSAVTHLRYRVVPT